MSQTFAPALSGLPGLALPGLAAAPRPDQVQLATGPLFAGVPHAATGSDYVRLSQHRDLWGPQPSLSLRALVAAVDAADLRGAGGAGFPTARKLQSMSGRPVSTIVVNGNEGEATSAKDGRLLALVPHQVLDGAVAAARALDCRRIVVRIGDDRPEVTASLHNAVAERDDRGITWQVLAAPHRFIGGEATALIQELSGRTALPRDLGRPPRDPRSRVRRGRVFLSNVETFARIAQASRGLAPTSALLTISGAVARPGVYEVPTDWTVAQVAHAAGATDNISLTITGGWHGAWVAWSTLADVRLARQAFDNVGARWGAGVLMLLPPQLAPRDVLTALAARLAAESAGQCGPCVKGLPLLARELAAGRDGSDVAAEVDGRGLCAHPSATVAAVRSALATIETVGSES